MGSEMCIRDSIHDVRLFLDGEGIFYLSQEASERGARPEHRSDVKVLTLPPDPLTHACYVREEGRWWLLFVCFVVIVCLPRFRNRSFFDEGSRIAGPQSKSSLGGSPLVADSLLAV